MIIYFVSLSTFVVVRYQIYNQLIIKLMSLTLKNLKMYIFIKRVNPDISIYWNTYQNLIYCELS